MLLRLWQQAIPQTLHMFVGHLVGRDVCRDALNQLSVVLGSLMLPWCTKYAIWLCTRLCGHGGLPNGFWAILKVINHEGEYSRIHNTKHLLWILHGQLSISNNQPNKASSRPTLTNIVGMLTTHGRMVQWRRPQLKGVMQCFVLEGPEQGPRGLRRERMHDDEMT